MPTEIAPDVYDVTAVERDGRRIPAYLFDVETPTLVDCGLAETTDTLLEGIAETGIDPERLVITHADRDHVGGWDAVVEAYGVETYLPEGADPDVDHAPDHRYGDGDRIGPFEAIHAPGHRDHQHVLLDEERGVAVMADAASGADQRGLPAGYFHLPPAMFSESLNEAEETLEKLSEREFDVGLVFHGSSVLEDASEKLRAYVDLP
jgi:glyoxylase-like metal-dependent hydrolase (beta-lactamase superfamily II)